jgi:hypothetical protein
MSTILNCDLVFEYREFRLKSQPVYRYITYKIVKQPNYDEIVADVEGEREEGWGEFIENFVVDKPTECRFGIIDLAIYPKKEVVEDEGSDFDAAAAEDDDSDDSDDEEVKHKLLFIFWSPLGAKTEQRDQYAAARALLQDAMTGMDMAVVANTPGDLSYTTAIAPLLEKFHSCEGDVR